MRKLLAVLILVYGRRLGDHQGLDRLRPEGGVAKLFLALFLLWSRGLFDHDASFTLSSDLGYQERQHTNPGYAPAADL